MVDSRKDTIPAFRFSQTMTRLSSSSTRCGPIKLTKIWGNSCPMFLSSLTVNETISAAFNFVGTDATGRTINTERLVVTGAIVTSVTHALAPLTSEQGAPSYDLEEITLDKMTQVEATNLLAGTSSVVGCAK
jgi:type VI protein secretion system component Hcp